MPPFWTPAKVFSFRLPKNQTLRDSSWQVQQQREVAWLGLLHMLKSSQTNDEQQSEQEKLLWLGFLHMLSSSKTNDEQQAFASIQTSQTFLIWHTKYKVIYQYTQRRHLTNSREQVLKTQTRSNSRERKTKLRVHKRQVHPESHVKCYKWMSSTSCFSKFFWKCLHFACPPFPRSVVVT